MILIPSGLTGYIDTDTQWAYWDGVRTFEGDKHDYLQCQIGNPDGADKPNKKYYDPRVWIRKAEDSMIARLGECMDKLGSTGTYPKSSATGAFLPLLGGVGEKRHNNDGVVDVGCCR